MTESTTVYIQQQQQPLLLESAGDVHLDTDEADDESDTTDGQLDDTVSSGALEALDSPIAHHNQR